MNNFELLEGWVTSLSREMGIDLEFDENGVCTIQVGEDDCMSLAPCEDNGEVFLLAGPVLALTMDPRVDGPICRACLKLNFMGTDTGQGVLGLGMHDGMIVLAHTVHYAECDATLLHNAVHNLAENIRRLREEILQRAIGSPGGQESPEPPDPLAMFGRFA